VWALALCARGRARRGVAPEPLARDPLDLGIDGGVLPDRTRELADAPPFDSAAHPLAIAVECARPAGKLEAERRRLGVRAVRTSHAHGLPMLLRPDRHE